MIDIVLDLETLGTAPGSVITQIGAAASDGQDLNIKISVTSALYYGLTVDADTLSWWRKQNEQTWQQVTSGASPIRGVLHLFSDWVKERRTGAPDATTGEAIRIWGDGATFDPVLLEAAYRACGIPCPWSYHEVYCYRTLRNLAKSDKPRSKTQHDALSDAKAQLVHLQELLQS